MRRKARLRTLWRRELVASALAHISILRTARSRLCSSLVWFAAWALIFQSTLAFCAMGAAVSGPDVTAAIICQSSADHSAADDSDAAAKQCASCPFCALGRSVTLPQASIIALPIPVVVAILVGRIDVISPLPPAHDLPVARGPPATA